MLVAAGLLAWLLSPPWAAVPVALGVFFLWFFRDPERAIPGVPGAIVSPGDGRVTDVATVEVQGEPRTRISIFLSVFDVHVNRSPIAGVIRHVEYRKGLFKNALGAGSARCNEQNVVTVDDGRQAVVFKQIAGLLARRIVFSKRVGDSVARGERVGLIKFGSRVDVLFDPAATVQVKVGQHVAGGASILAMAPVITGVAPELSAFQQGGGRL
jgi:phosphatidylserine decarboxylase